MTSSESQVRVGLDRDGKMFFVTPCDGRFGDFFGPWQAALTDPHQTKQFSIGTSCTANDVNAVVIQKRWGGAIMFDDELTQATYNLCLAGRAARQLVAETHARWQERRAVPCTIVAPEPVLDAWHDGTEDSLTWSPTYLELKPNVDVHDDPALQLADFQQTAAAASRMTSGYLLYMEQGTGKTPVVIARACTDAREMREAGQSRMYRVLIVCPKGLRANWKNEFERFATVSGKITVMRGWTAARIKMLADAMSQPDGEHFTVVIVSYGLLAQAWDNCLSHVPWDLAVLDEGHAIKSPYTNRSKLALQVRDRSAARMLLTGTPVVNSALDLYSQLEFIQSGLSGHASYNSFKEKYAVLVKSEDGRRDVMVAVKNMPLLKQRLAECAFIVKKKDVLPDLPEKQYDMLEVELTTRQMEDYWALASKLYLEIATDLAEAEGDEHKTEMVLANALVKVMKLSQITSGFLIINGERDENGEKISEDYVHYYDDNPKADLLVEEMRALPEDEKLIIWCCWVPEIKRLAGRFEAEGLDVVTYYGGTSDRDRTIAERRFNRDPNCRFMLANPACGGVGLNLLGYPYDSLQDDVGTNCTRHIVCSQSWKPVERWQCEDRSNRRGSRVPLKITDLVAPETVDEEIRARVLAKKAHALDVQDIRSLLSMIAKGRQ